MHPLIIEPIVQLATVTVKFMVVCVSFLFCFLALGVANQRETTIVWDKKTGKPLYNAIGKHRINHY